MLAHHPLTGKPIKILRTATQIATDSKSMIVVTPTMAPSPRYSRYYVAIQDPAAIPVLSGGPVSVILAMDAAPWIPVLPTLLASSPELLVFAKRSVMDAWEAAGIASERILVLEDLTEAYPWLGEPLTSDSEHVFLAIAHVLRFHKILWPYTTDRDALPLSARLLYDMWSRNLGGSLQAVGVDDTCIPRTVLIQQYYKSEQGRRHREIKTCLEKNLASPYIDRVVLLNETAHADLPVSEKLTTVLVGKRLTYYDAFVAAQTHVAAGDFVVIANSDIWFNETLLWLWRIPLKEQALFLALLRWEDTASGSPHIFGPRADSQDTWIVARDSLTFPLVKDDLDYPFGQSGCDNAIALDMMRNKLVVVNPAYTIKTMHLHRSNVRTYDPKNILYRQFYLHLEPTAIQPIHVDTKMDTVRGDMATQWKERHLCESFVRPILTTNPVVERTLCKMLQTTHQEGTMNWNYVVGSQNRYVPPPTPMPLYNIRGGAFITATGLVSDWRRMYVGPHKRWVSGWEGSRNTTLTQCQQVASALALPCSPEALRSLSRWVLEYVPRVLTVYELLQPLRAELPEFGVPSLPHIGEFLRECSWPGLAGKSVNVLPLLEDVQVYATDVWAVPPADEPVAITREDVCRLRSLIHADGGSPKPKPCAVLCVEDTILTRDWADSVSEYILSKGWTVKILATTDSFKARKEALVAADWVIGSGESLDWIWCLREGKTVLEFMRDSEPVGDHVHLAGAAGLRYIAALVKTEPVELQRQHAMMDVGKAMSQYGFKELVAVAREPTTPVPVITLPKGRGLTGMFAHSGDTFREMARIWGERGYCKIKESDQTSHCWWGEIGEILLYDRPTLRWFDEKMTYQMALFGNCPPPDPARLRQSVWSFWPRSPKAIETLVASHKCLKTWDERTISSLFLGKVENGVQLAARSTADWSKAVELFSMPVDSTGAAYPFTQSEYLNKLCSARFGLCLPGFGKKCNREIEYFACGTVPIIVGDVDMTNYLVPPVIGVHYFAAKTPEDVQRIVTTTTKETWLSMSVACRAWWRSYASAEGFFRLTWARIEQCRPYFTVGIPPLFNV